MADEQETEDDVLVTFPDPGDDDSGNGEEVLVDLGGDPKSENPSTANESEQNESVGEGSDSVGTPEPSTTPETDPAPEPDDKEPDPETEKLRNALIGKDRENREIKRQLKDLTELVKQGQQQQPKSTEQAPIDEWLSKQEDPDRLTMSDVPLSVQRAQSSYDQKQAREQASSQQQSQADGQAKQRAKDRVNAVLEDSDTNALISMANTLMDDHQAQQVSEQILGAPDVKAATKRAKIAASLIINEMGSEAQKRAAAAILNQQPKPSSENSQPGKQTQGNSQNESAETDALSNTGLMEESVFSDMF